MCVAPVPLKNDTAKHSFNKAFTGIKSNVINVPCGKCIECRKSHMNGWIFRLINEFKASTTETAYFLTLTYTDENLPVTEDGEITLDYRDHQLYMKRLRKSLPNAKIKYFTVGEYGDRTQRPHFHSIIFNATQNEVLNAWDKGAVHFGEVNEKTIAYTLKYAMKKIGRVYKKDWRDPNTSRAVERALISKGVGIEYAQNQNNIKYYQDDLTRQVIKESGVVQSLPRYYKQKFYTETQLQARSRLLSERMEQIAVKSDISERHALAKKDFRDTQKKEKTRKIVGD